VVLRIARLDCGVDGQIAQQVVAKGSKHAQEKCFIIVVSVELVVNWTYSRPSHVLWDLVEILHVTSLIASGVSGVCGVLALAPVVVVSRTETGT